MHRDPARHKCPALPFGEHRNFTGWPHLVTVKNLMKVVGAIFSNNEDIEILNTDWVAQFFYNCIKLQGPFQGGLLFEFFQCNHWFFSYIHF